MLLTKADKEHEEYVWSIVSWYVHGLEYLHIYYRDSDSTICLPRQIKSMRGMYGALLAGMFNHGLEYLHIS
jgi:hypothetical protein